MWGSALAGLRRAWLVLLAALAVLAGCRPAPAPRPGGTNIRVAEVEVVGAESVPRAELLAAMATRENTPNPFVPPGVFNRFEFAADVQRIETFYASRGYFDARVSGHEVVFDDSGRHGRARVVYTVEEGLQSSLAADAVYHIEPLRGIDMTHIIGATELRRGRPYSQADVEAERERLRRELQERSFARAQVEARVYALPETHTVEVAFFFSPGTACVFGDLIVSGNVNVPADVVREVSELRAGRAYQHSRLRNAQVELYALDAFTSVEVVPVLGEGAAVARDAVDLADAVMGRRGLQLIAELRDPARVGPLRAGLLDNLDEIETADPAIDIVITVSESPEASYRAGGGLGIESSRTEAYTRSSATWRNVLAPLNRAEAEARIGYAWLPSVFDRDALARGIVGAVSAGLTRPRLLFGVFDATLRVGFKHGVETDFSYSTPSARLGVENRLGPLSRVTAGYAIEVNLTNDFASSIADQVEVRGACDELPRAFRIGYLEAGVFRERSNFDPSITIYRRRGAEHHDWAGTLRAQLGEGLLGDYPYLRVEPDLRYYARLSRRFVVATRGAVGTIADLGGAVPRNQCLFLGGGSTIRGFPERRAGPHAGENVPNGGVFSLLLNLEPRLALTDVFGLVAFLDLGEVNTGLGVDRSFGGATGMHAAAGGGLRLYTPIGPVRADVGTRLTDLPAGSGRVRGVQFFVSLGEAF